MNWPYQVYNVTDLTMCINGLASLDA